MNYYNSETLLEQQAEIENLREQNAALAAQVIILTRKIFATYHNQINVSVDNKRGVMDVFKDVGELFELAKTAPQQHLAEIRAEAGRAGFVKCADMMNDACIDMNDVWSGEQVSKAANEYAEQIRKGEVE